MYLSPINIEDAELYTKWLNDYTVSRNLGLCNQMISLDSERKILEKLASEGQNFAIVQIEGDVLIGNISLMDLDHINRKATLGIFIGDEANRGKGYGLEAVNLILEYGFKTLNLHNIMLLVHSDNEQAISCYKKAGFTVFGCQRESKFKNGKYIDLIYMDILDTDFYALMG